MVEEPPSDKPRLPDLRRQLQAALVLVPGSRVDSRIRGTKGVMANSDVASVVELMYQLDTPRGDWLTRVTESMRPIMDRHHMGVVGAFYTCPDACTWRIESTVVQDVAPRILVDYLSFLSTPPATLLDDTVLSRRWYVCSQLRRWSDIQLAFDNMSGAADKLTLTALEPDGNGCLFGSFQRDRTPASQALSRTLSLLGTHLTAAHRLRAHLSRSDVDEATFVLDPAGRLQGVSGRTPTAAGRARLQRVVRARDRARSRKGLQEPALLDDWQSFVEMGLTLIDRFERDGRRWVLAIDNRPAPVGLAQLSQREREVVRQAVLGLSNKVIAYNTGLAHSTVRVLLARAAAKLGARSRAELVAQAAPRHTAA
jgi:DNA-binding CsgD family transcriptional regulator